MKIKTIQIFWVLVLILLFSHGAEASELKKIKLKTNFKIWEVDLKKNQWISAESEKKWNSWNVDLPMHIKSDLRSSVKNIINETENKSLNKSQVTQYLKDRVHPYLKRPKEDVSISLNEKGEVVFEGFAVHGQDLNIDQTFELINQAYQMGESEVRLPVKKIEPIIQVNSPELIEKGITHLLSTGETDFSGSPYNRLVNIDVGLTSFNGVLVGPDEKSGAGEILGEISGRTGYLPELVIKGDKTLPEYGGGLCQVSTTVYRGLLFAGIEITQRKNHSYAVSYYDPQGLDATIYPPYVDMKFKNNTQGHILIQTKADDNGRAYANIYGTPTHREVDLIGPYYYDHRSVPANRIEYTDQLAPGVIKKVGSAHAGFKASWYRRIIEEGKEDKLEHIYSHYQARPNFTLVGQASSAENVE